MGGFVRGDFFFSQLRAETCSGLIKRNKMDFFSTFLCTYQPEKAEQRECNQKYYLKHGDLKKNEFVPAVFASLKQANNSVMVTHILTERKLWKLMRTHGKQSLPRERNQPARSQTALITNSISNTYSYSWEYQRELQ